MLRRLLVHHQLSLSLNLMLVGTLFYVLIPSLRSWLRAFAQLSYADAVGGFSPGPRDLYLVCSFIVIFTAVRAFCLDYVLIPLAVRCYVRTRKARLRFAEQGYMMVYYLLYWSWGLHLFIQNTPPEVHDINSLLISIWTGYPRLYMSQGVKLYYLSQFAFWIQQFAVLHIESRRKDHMQMLLHHVITAALIAGSHSYRQWRAGNAILVCMDIVDFIFPLAKCLKYMELQNACDVAFGFFVLAWVSSRHIAYNAICYSVYSQVSNVVMPYGTYSTRTGAQLSTEGGHEITANLLQPFLYPESETVSFNASIRFFFLALLLALQGITIAWFIMICRVVVRVLHGKGAEEPRSDGEDEEEELEIDGKDGSVNVDKIERDEVEAAQPLDHAFGPALSRQDKRRFIEVESSSEEIVTSSSRISGTRKKPKGISSSLNLGEHKTILNRIGCLSEEQLAREREKREEK
ncbi:longevity assurance proteins LAG1/LAC1 [Piedraia hortae CBS 480.64]|uniref:Longevity assurance proteins LAG1/LAC1 n=1 Tax=Piedraia hortae CBS 480.64 TaxID=1314780 RepID=A0A6A7BSH5_9PEZI|nr:longevity assurance proteins LAG1/LAC1 [Piedraia hortae CBS 480.64]